MADTQDQPAEARPPEPSPAHEPGHHWFEAVADHTGPAYLRYSFTKGTVNEVDFLVDVLGLEPGHRVCDVGCGPGRHTLELARRGIETVGVDIADRFVQLGTEAAVAEKLELATFQRGDIRALADIGPFDAVISLCQGGFGLPVAREDGVDDDVHILKELATLLRSEEGVLAISAFSAYFQVQHLDAAHNFDAARGVHHENTSIKNPDGADLPFDLWTRCFAPAELRLLATAAGLACEDIWSVTPGEYARNAPTVETPEFLMVARRP